MNARLGRRAIYLSRDRYRAFMGDLCLIPAEAQAKLLGVPALNLRRALQGCRVGDRTIAGMLTGAEAIAASRGGAPAQFETLFEVRPVDTAALANAA